MLDDTIAAISTPLGEAGLAVIRISGPAAPAIASEIFRLPSGKNFLPASAASHKFYYGKVTHRGKWLDEALLVLFKAPRSFTREDVVEIHCHGGVLPAKKILDAVFEHGARMAGPGEFTKRAFLNGRIDLTQAEAIADLIHSKTELALSAASEQLAGKLASRIEKLRDGLMRTLAHVEAYIDFPDEDIAPDTMETIQASVEQTLQGIDLLLATAQEGQILRRGVRAAIIGRPNVGKSSLLNQLLGRERAIVSPVPGTTRDTIEEMANIRGLPIIFVDTAGLRQSEDVIEAEGIRRSHETRARAELILHVLDHSESLSPEDETYLQSWPGKKRILVINKSDLPGRLHLPDGIQSPVIKVSCVTGAGLEELKDCIEKLVWGGEVQNEMLEVMINSRHQEALLRAQAALLRTRATLLAQDPLELSALELRLAVNAIGEIVGKTSTEDLLDSIFSQFCIGK